MLDFTLVIVSLYGEVLQQEKRYFAVSDHDIQIAIRNMKDVYLPNPDWQMKQSLIIADYDDPAHRVAYLHKYAMCYTGLVCDMLQLAIINEMKIHQYINSKRCLNICSLGGGPGTDVIGALAAIIACCQYMPCSVSILDCSPQWVNTFSLVINTLKRGPYGQLKTMVKDNGFRYQYLTANLLTDITSKAAIRNAVQSADFLTMVKFISAAACQQTRNMVTTVFKCMKPGAMLLFIDNAAGGFQSMMAEVAVNCGITSVFGPLLHYDYENTEFNIKRFGYNSQSKTKVSIQIWQKPQRNLYNASFDHRLPIAHASYDTIDSPLNRRLISNPSFSERNRRATTQGDENSGCCSII